MIIKQLKRSFLRISRKDPLTVFFIIIGVRFYFDWILPTNPVTKNPLFRLIYKKNWITKISPTERLNFCYGFIAVHLFLGVFLPSDSIFYWENILANIYPILVQIYIGVRCYRIIKKRYKVVSKETKSFKTNLT